MIKLGFSVLNIDLDFLEQLSKNATEIVEVGSGVGISSNALASNGSIVHCVDTWEGTPRDLVEELYEEHGSRKIFETFCKNAGDRLFKTIFPHVGSSLLYASVWPRQVDLVFIDGAHDYKSVKSDIAAWLPHVKKNGIICGHDYKAFNTTNGVEMFPGVRQAVDELGPVGLTGTVWWKRV